MMAVSHDGGARPSAKIYLLFPQAQAISALPASRAPTAFPRSASIPEMDRAASTVAIFTSLGVITAMAMWMFSFHRRAITAKPGALLFASTAILYITAKTSFSSGWLLTRKAAP